MIPIFKKFYIHFKIKQKNLHHLKEHQDLLERLDTPRTPDYVCKVEKEINEQKLYYKRAGTPEYRRKVEKQIEQQNLDYKRSRTSEYRRKTEKEYTS